LGVFNLKKRKGFSLVEMLVIIAVIGILVGLTFPAISALRNASKANDQVPRQAAYGLPNSIDAYKYVDNGHTYIIFHSSHGLEVLEQK
jgi:prepilin-type N-terminal cleavage/methylation domain-containing protein